MISGIDEKLLSLSEWIIQFEFGKEWLEKYEPINETWHQHQPVVDKDNVVFKKFTGKCF